MNQFEILNSKLKVLNDELINFASTLEFKVNCEFNIENFETQIKWDELNCNGVYFIQIKNNKQFTDFNSWVINFRDEWEDDRYKRKFVSNLKNKRISKHTELKEWIPLYIGKSKNISKRVREHITKKLTENTFALKLGEREHAKKEIFQLNYINVPSLSYNWIMPVIENELREKHHPIIGKQ